MTLVYEDPLSHPTLILRMVECFFSSGALSSFKLRHEDEKHSLIVDE